MAVPYQQRPGIGTTVIAQPNRDWRAALEFVDGIPDRFVVLIKTIRGTSATPFAQSAKPYLSNFLINKYITMGIPVDAWP